MTWKIPIKGNGTYEVFSYIAKNRRGRRDDQETAGEYTYTIYHEQEKEEVVVELKSAEDGWNSLGSYIFSGDTVKIELGNKSAAKVVVADAVKLVRQ